MTMMMTNSQFGLEDMEALLWEPSFPTADAMSSLFYKADQEPQEAGGSLLEGDASPASPLTSSSLSSSSSPHPFYSPPPSPPAALLLEDKAGTDSDPLALPSLGHPGQLRSTQMISDYSKEDVFGDLDWMAERVDLSELDLDCLIGSCNATEESPNCAEDFLSSLDYSMELDCHPVPSLSTPVPPSFPLQSPPVVPDVCSEASVIEVDESESCVDGQEAPSSPPSVPEPQEELEIKSEPATLDLSSPMVDSPSSPADTLDLGSEVDVSESEVQPAVAAVVPQVPLVISLSPTRIVFVLAPKENVRIATTTASTKSEVLPSSSAPQRSTRSRPYPESEHKASSCDATSVKVKSAQGAGGDDRPSLKAPKDKKSKKMEQNKTAATRYRQKKRAEQDALLEEHVILERKNMELTEKAESMAREIEYLKELMEEVRQARTGKGLSTDP
ncbi:activating transcription factor 4b [Betta splendens]|uniref:Cyclic AMP-dependent transcription factor ATF-4 n=1 Tax=Betta splendens TaxID=158456 RepID=A0A6P7N4Z7_BETSP|nr:activating transcription factor 4b [Betta splendens]